jgi:hypothetical protein
LAEVSGLSLREMRLLRKIMKILQTFNPKKVPFKKIYQKRGNTFPILVVFSVWTGRKPWTGLATL